MRDVEARIAEGGLFHTRGAATENARSLNVERRMRGTVRVDVADERR